MASAGDRTDSGTTPTTKTPTAQRRFTMLYFELATQADTDSYFAQFTDDATVEDDGKHYSGIDEIRGWRTEIPRVHYDVRHVERHGSSAHARVDVSGDFPGSPVTLHFEFDYADDDQIAALRIRL
jgi:hypothetical protein